VGEGSLSEILTLCRETFAGPYPGARDSLEGACPQAGCAKRARHCTPQRWVPRPVKRLTGGRRPGNASSRSEAQTTWTVTPQQNAVCEREQILRLPVGVGGAWTSWRAERSSPKRRRKGREGQTEVALPGGGLEREGHVACGAQVLKVISETHGAAFRLASSVVPDGAVDGLRMPHAQDVPQPT